MNSKIKTQKEHETHAHYKKIGSEIGFSYVLVFAQIAIAPLSVALLTRILGKEQYGIYALFSVLIGLFSLALQPGFSQYLIAKLHGFHKNRWPHIFFSLLAFELVLIISVLAVFYFSPLSEKFLEINKLGKYSHILLISLGVIFFGTFGGLFDNYYRAKQHLNIANLMEFVRIKGWALPLFLLFLYFKKFSVGQVFLIWAAFTFLTFAAYLVISEKELFSFLKKPEIDYGMIKTALKFSVPLVPASILSWVILASDRYLLNYYTSASIVGVYSLAYSLLGLLYTLGMTANGVILPYFAEARLKDKAKYDVFFSASLKYGLMVVIPGSVGVFILKKELITLLSGSAYLAAAPVVGTLLFFPIFGFLFYMGSNTLVLNNRTVLGGAIYLVAAVLNVVLNIILIPKYGMHGSAMATVTSYFVMCVLAMYFAKDYVVFKFKFIKIPGILISTAVMGIVLYFIHPTHVVTKILAMLLGIGIYFGMAIATKVLEKSELDLIKASFVAVLKFGRKDLAPE